MREIGYGFQHDLDCNVQIVIVVKLVYFEYGQIGFQVVSVLLGLHFDVVFQRGQMLRVVPEEILIPK